MKGDVRDVFQEIVSRQPTDRKDEAGVGWHQGMEEIFEFSSTLRGIVIKNPVGVTDDHQLLFCLMAFVGKELKKPLSRCHVMVIDGVKESFSKSIQDGNGQVFDQIHLSFCRQGGGMPWVMCSISQVDEALDVKVYCASAEEA